MAKLFNKFLYPLAIIGLFTLIGIGSVIAATSVPLGKDGAKEYLLYPSDPLFANNYVATNTLTASVFPLLLATTSTTTNATTTTFGVLNLNASNCDVKSTTGGSLFCGTDANSGGGTSNSKWATSSQATYIEPNSALGIIVGLSTSTNATTTNFFASTASTTRLFVDTILSGGGSANAPGIAFANDTNTGIYRINADVLGFSLNGGEELQLTTTQIRTQNNGSASAPVYTWDGDNDIGMWRPTANNLAFSTNAIEAFRINSAQNLGIGTTTPNWTLQLASSTPYLAITDADTEANLKHWIITNTNGLFSIGTATDALDATSTGLSISSNGRLRAPSLANCDTIDGDTLGFLSCGTDGGGAGGSPNSKWASTTDNLGIYPNVTDVKVGIGTTTPFWSLHVASATPYLALTDSDALTNRKHWLLSNIGGTFRLGTSTDALNSTSTALSLEGAAATALGIGTSSPGTVLSIGDTGNNTINISNTSTSTFGMGLHIKSGGLRVATVPSCSEALETDGNGNVVCGTDAGGGGVTSATTTHIRGTSFYGLEMDANDVLTVDGTFNDTPTDCQGNGSGNQQGSLVFKASNLEASTTVDTAGASNGTNDCSIAFIYSYTATTTVTIHILLSGGGSFTTASLRTLLLKQ